MKYRLGLKPVHTQPRLQLSSYFTSDLPSVESLPQKFGHSGVIRPQMFMNDQLGDCAIAGSIEEVRLLNALRGVTVNFTDETAVQNYSEIAGYDPDDPESDQGTDVHDLYEFRQTTGIVDADGNRHKILAWAGLTPGDFDELLIALSLFEVVGVGIQVPEYAEAQFEAGGPWQLKKGRHSIVGGHYIPAVGRNYHAAQIYTWGGQIDLDDGFYSTLSNVAVVALTEEMFTDGKSPEGVDMAKLAHDLGELNTGPVMDRAPQGPPVYE